MFVEALTALFGAVAGGLLVLIGEILRRRSERRGRAVDRLLAASADFAMVINRTSGEIIDARLRQLPRPGSALRAERHEATTKFFMTPAPPELHDAGRRLAYAYHDLYDHFDEDDGWAEAWDNYRASILQFEAAARDVARLSIGSRRYGGGGLRRREGRAGDEPSPSIRPYGWRRGSGSGAMLGDSGD